MCYVGTAAAQVPEPNNAAPALATAAQSQALPTALPLRYPDYRLQPRRIADGIWVLEGAVDDFSVRNGCNIINTALLTSPDATVSWVINTGPSRLYGEQQRKAFAALGTAKLEKILNLNLHPDYFFGNQAWADLPSFALAGSIAGMQAEGASYADNMYRLCTNWMQGTEMQPAQHAITPQPNASIGSASPAPLTLLRLNGHTADDLVLIEPGRNVVFAGGLIFADRVPTTPHADFAAWRASLDKLAAYIRPDTIVVPSHGPVHRGHYGLAQTRDWLDWLESTLSTSASQGLDLGEVLHLEIPARFSTWAALRAEYQRSVAQHYPRYERKVME